MCSLSSSTYSDLQGKTVLIAGSTGILGTALLDCFIRTGCKLILLSRTEIVNSKFPTDVKVYTCDLSQPFLVNQAIDAIMGENRVDIFVYSAGINLQQEFGAFDTEGMLDTLAVNLISPALIMHKVGEHMQQHKQTGSIVCISSIKGQEASADVSYGASKAGLIQTVRTFASRYARHGVRVNAIAPGPLEQTACREMSPDKYTVYLKRTARGQFTSPQEVAETVLFLASQASSAITGQCINVDGGYRL